MMCMKKRLIVLSEKEGAKTLVDDKSTFSLLMEAVLGAGARDPILREELVSIKGCRLGYGYMRRPNTWPNDEVVNSYMELLLQRIEKMKRA